MNLASSAIQSRLLPFSILALSICLLFTPVADDLEAQQTIQGTLQPASQAQQSDSDPPAPPKYVGPVARGRVFTDLDNDGIYSPQDGVFVGARVSNGDVIVKTNDKGAYELPIKEGQTIFLIKPTGFRTALNDEKLPMFYYTHKPDGSPKLKYPGSKPTGPLPKSIDFPLYQQTEPNTFQMILFGDPQPRNIQEVDYIAEDVVAELVGTNAAFGVTLGDVVFDGLELFQPLNEAIALIGVPWYNVIGNHDINLDAKNRDEVNETFESVYGPTYYSFDYGQVHFVVLDNIDWEMPGENREKAGYVARFGETQREWLKKDLAMIPESQMVCLLMHIPIKGAKDCEDLYRIIESRPLSVSISGHTHDHQHLFLTEKDGWKGKTPHHHIINVTVSGSWWSGQKDERGIPHSTMGDGAPNGYSIMTFDGQRYKLDFKAAGRNANEQMRINIPRSIDSAKTGETEISVNVYNGSEKSTVQMSINNGDPITMSKLEGVPDPFFVNLTALEAKVSPKIKPALGKAKPCSHLWSMKLPENLPPGTHTLNVKTTDMHGRDFYARKSFRVTGEKEKDN